MIVHLFPQEKFTVPFINFINNKFNNKDNLFLIHGQNDAYNKIDVEQFGNIRYVNRNQDIGLFIKHMNKANKIIIHSLFVSNKLLLYLFLNKKVFKKCSWVIWGGDLYSYRVEKKTLKSKILEGLKKEIIKGFSMIITLSNNDYNLAQKWYGAQGIHKQAMYINPISFDYLKKIKLSKIKNSDLINIQIGNSADPSNLHFEVIDILKKFKDENIKIYVPLSYGDSKHAIKVKEYGESIFKDKFIAMMDFLNKDEYGDFLGKIDIAIFNNNRQQALGNIRALAYLGSKIYMRDDTTMWSDFISEGYNISKINQLKNETFEEFILNNQSNANLNSDLAEDTFNEERIAVKWTDIFNS